MSEYDNIPQSKEVLAEMLTPKQQIRVMNELGNIPKYLSQKTNDASLQSGLFLLVEVAMTGFTSIPSYIGAGSIGLLIALRQWEKFHTNREINQQKTEMQAELRELNRDQYIGKEEGVDEIREFQKDRQIYAIATGAFMIGASIVMGILNGVNHTLPLATFFEVIPPFLSALSFMYVDEISAIHEEIEISKIFEKEK